MNNIFKNLSKTVVLGATMALLAFAPAFADEAQTVESVENTVTVEQVVVEETTEEVVENTTQESTDLEALMNSVQTNFTSKEELDAYCKANGYSFTRNASRDSLNGESYFFVIVCGTEAKVEVTVNPVVKEDAEEDSKNDDTVVEEETTEEDATEEEVFEEETTEEETTEEVVEEEVVEEETTEKEEIVVEDNTTIEENEVTEDVTVEEENIVVEEKTTIKEELAVEKTVTEAVEVQEVANTVDYLVNPKTGDNSVVIYILGAVASIAGLVVSNKKRN